VIAGAEARDHAAVFPAEEIRVLAAQGWLGLRAEPTTGGEREGESARSTLATLLAVSEFARACASIGLLIGLHNLLVCDAVAEHALDPMRGEFLSRLARGEWLGAAAFADPMTARSSGAAAVAVRSGDGFILSGAKSFVPGAAGADLFLVYAFLGEGPGDARHAHRERCLLLVPRDAEGVSVDPPDPLVGVRASGTATVHFDGCRIRGRQRLAPSGWARGIARGILAAADLVVAAQAVGIAEAAFEKAVRQAQEREPSGSLVGSHESIQFKIADMRVMIDAATLFVMRAARARDARDPGFAYEAAQAKAFAGRAAVKVADEAIQIHGGAGSLAGHGIERHWRDAKTTELNPSTRETAMLAVARHLLDEADGGSGRLRG